MPGYVIADVTVTDPETYADYRALTPGSIAAFDGRFLVRGGEHEMIIKGPWSPGRLVLLEFDSLAQAEAWYNSPTYVKARAIRQSASTGAVVMVEGDNPAKRNAEAYVIARHGAVDPGLRAVDLHGGRVLASARVTRHKEVAWIGSSARLSVIEFGNYTAAVAWSGSVTERQATGGVVLVEGVVPVEGT